MEKICFILLSAILLSCSKRTEHPYTFYYWRTHLSLDEAEKTTLQNATSPYLYTRFFDIEKVNGKFQPVAVITQDSTFKTDKEIVPVVGIKNEVFYDITLAEIDFLARNVAALIRKKQNDFAFRKSGEIQIDCDWTAGTNKEYFAFLEKLQQYSGKKITCTLRLHQVQNSKLSGVPPVEKVYLMCYSTSAPLENSTRRSILDLPTLKKYLKNLHFYPLQMDIVLPIYSWAIVTDHAGKRKLINALSLKDLENPHFKKLSESEVEIMQDGFYSGNFLNKGFKLKVEEVTKEQLDDVKLFLNKKLGHYSIIYHHLDSSFLKNHSL